jgi:hypothetical protein
MLKIYPAMKRITPQPLQMGRNILQIERIESRIEAQNFKSSFRE